MYWTFGEHSEINSHNLVKTFSMPVHQSRLGLNQYSIFRMGFTMSILHTNNNHHIFEVQWLDSQRLSPKPCKRFCISLIFLTNPYNALFPHYCSCSPTVDFHICYHTLAISSESPVTLWLSFSAQASPNSTDSRCGRVTVFFFFYIAHVKAILKIAGSMGNMEQSSLRQMGTDGTHYEIRSDIHIPIQREREKEKDDRGRESDR